MTNITDSKVTELIDFIKTECAVHKPKILDSITYEFFRRWSLGLKGIPGFREHTWTIEYIMLYSLALSICAATSFKEGLIAWRIRLTDDNRREELYNFKIDEVNLTQLFQVFWDEFRNRWKMDIDLKQKVIHLSRPTSRTFEQDLIYIFISDDDVKIDKYKHDLVFPYLTTLSRPATIRYESETESLGLLTSDKVWDIHNKLSRMCDSIADRGNHRNLWIIYRVCAGLYDFEDDAERPYFLSEIP